MSRPLVSVAIPTWNRISWLRAALASAQAQTYEPLEIVVSDNASTDGTAEMVRELARGDDRIKLFVNETNIGPVNYVAVLQRCRGEYVKFLNDDDVLVPGAVARLAAPLDDPAVSLSIARQDWMNEQGRLLSLAELKPDFKWWMDFSNLGNESRLIPGFDIGNYCMMNTINAFGCPSAHLFRRAELDPVTSGMIGGRRYSSAGDVAYCLQLAAGRTVAYIAEKTVVLRMHNGQESANPTVQAATALEWLDLVQHTRELGYLADDSDRVKALRKVGFLLANQLEPGATDETARRVAEGLGIAATALRELGRATLPVQSRGGKLVATPDWTSTRPLLDLFESWARNAHTMPEDELVLEVDANMFALDRVVGQVEHALNELGLDPDTVPDITIEPIGAPVV
jgi:hypothetical protein